MCRYAESKLPEGFSVHVDYITRHRKPFNDSVPKWLTLAKLLDPNGKVVARGMPKCGPKDNPNRKVGRAVAVGRAHKAYHERRAMESCL